MIIAFQRVIGTTCMSMVMDEDWDVLKIMMCDKWQIEEPFDRHLVWDGFRDGDVVTYNGDMYQVWNSNQRGEYADELFQGRHIEIFDEEPYQ